jgi:hypothetical protein
MKHDLRDLRAHNPLFLRGSDKPCRGPIAISDSGFGHVNTWKEVINGRKEI